MSAGDGTVSEIEPSTGAVLATYTVGYSPNGLAYADGDLWVSFNYADTVEEFQASTGNLLGTFDVGSSPGALTFDGSNIWVTNQGSSSVTEIKASNGAIEAHSQRRIDAMGDCLRWKAYMGHR